MQPAVQSRYLGAAVPAPGPDDRSWVILCSHDADLQLRRTEIDTTAYAFPCINSNNKNDSKQNNKNGNI